jgi:hypothetical protein
MAGALLAPVDLPDRKHGAALPGLRQRTRRVWPGPAEWKRARELCEKIEALAGRVQR